MKKYLILLAHAFVVWALCGATMGIGMSVTSENTAVTIHAIGAPIFSGIATYVYYKRFGGTTILETASVIVLFIIFTDAYLVAPVFEKS